MNIFIYYINMSLELKIFDNSTNVLHLIEKILQSIWLISYDSILLTVISIFLLIIIFRFNQNTNQTRTVEAVAVVAATNTEDFSKTKVSLRAEIAALADAAEILQKKNQRKLSKAELAQNLKQARVNARKWDLTQNKNT